MNTVYSIGYGVRTQEGFINTLQMLGVDTVIDIRSIPDSRYAPQFNEDVIYDALSEKGIGYFSGGGRLGGRPSDISLYDQTGRVDWEAFRSSPAYREGIGSIERLAGEGHVVAVVCSEGDPLLCHRFGTVTRDLSADGMDVRHVLSNGEVGAQELMEDRLLEKYKQKNAVSTVLTGSYREQVEEAYRQMNRERGYRPKPRHGTKLRFMGFKH